MLSQETVKQHREDYKLSTGRYICYSEADVTLDIDVEPDCWDYPGGTTVDVSKVTNIRAEIKVGDDYVTITDLTDAEIAEIKTWFESQEYDESDLLWLFDQAN